MRDSKGRFIRGHPCLNDRDTATGRFIAKPKDRYSQVRSEVDEFLSKEMNK